MGSISAMGKRQQGQILPDGCQELVPEGVEGRGSYKGTVETQFSS